MLLRVIQRLKLERKKARNADLLDEIEQMKRSNKICGRYSTHIVSVNTK